MTKGLLSKGTKYKGLKIAGILLFILIISNEILSQNHVENEFYKIDQSDSWILKLYDNCQENWQLNWNLDGLQASVTNTTDGMAFSAGPIERDDACHAVLWTKKSFEGDIKIEYGYTRIDTLTKYVNIIYVQASGIDISPYSKDISEWSNLRTVPSMKLYFNHMNALHISYAAFNLNDPEKRDYIRVRKYPVVDGFNNTEVPPTSYKTGLFIPGETYNITVIKIEGKLFFQVKGQNTESIYNWELAGIPAISAGRVGLRHMYTRSATYKDFKIYTK